MFFFFLFTHPKLGWGNNGKTNRHFCAILPCFAPCRIFIKIFGILSVYGGFSVFPLLSPAREGDPLGVKRDKGEKAINTGGVGCVVDVLGETFLCNYRFLLFFG